MYILPKLKCAYDAYEPHIDAETMEIHHSKHHNGYVTKLNQALVDENINEERIESLFENIELYPSSIRNNAGGHYNHTIFWSILCQSSISAPSEELSNAINQTFGNIDTFRDEFLKKAGSVFGSGWCWFVVKDDGSLAIVTTKNQDNPLMSDINTGYPLFGIDVWEHAYYLKYQNKRAEYLEAVWSLLNWGTISQRFENKPEMNEVLSG